MAVLTADKTHQGMSKSVSAGLLQLGKIKKFTPVYNISLSHAAAEPGFNQPVNQSVSQISNQPRQHEVLQTGGTSPQGMSYNGRAVRIHLRVSLVT